MWVVKLGGSLAGDDRLKSWLEAIATLGTGKVVIVPGGGRFADQVRQAQRRWQFDDRTAHRMALLAMHQYGRMLAGIVPGLVPAYGAAAVCDLLRTRQVGIWLPDADELDRAGIPACWTVTSDSLAAWLAGILEAKGLILVKAVMPDVQDMDTLCRQGIVDAAFPTWMPKTVELAVCHVGQLAQFVQRLQSE